MLNILRGGGALLNDINNFIKTEAEIVNDFKTRISNTLRSRDTHPSKADRGYTEIIQRITDVESIFFTSISSLHIEENY